MSRSGINFNGAVELKLNLNMAQQMGIGSSRPPAAESSPETSPARSCVSSEDGLKYSSSPETTSMMLVGCPRCLMYVMLSDVDPRCPKCKSTVLLDLHRHYDDRNNNHNGRKRVRN